MITLATQVTPAEGVLWRHLGGESVLLDMASGMYFGLDEVGSRIWSLLTAGEPLDRIVAVLAAEYHAPAQRLCADVLAHVNEMHESGLVVVDET